ncbi:uracil-xanthine permease family protein [Capillibacterium thermochitinicola]|uniref:Uracil permease n=1 Tax=Capillibacterium thermochitinicola TaxID=2699427 RepID=A0A8J6I0F1_9FIRM|nr:solute carrier family 23 protein [Capillibacterium thermochitinicola]MBA2133335.1 uracil permease [Capillibacterium thermochitinicola]
MEKIIDVKEKPTLRRWIPLSLQHVFAMFGATVLVPFLVTLNTPEHTVMLTSTALFTSGLGTLLYILITQGKVPAYLGSSFAFIAPLISISTAYGFPYAMGGAFFVGLIYVGFALIIKFFGLQWLDKILPPVVIGSIIVTIGLNLAPTAMDMAMKGSGDTYNLYYVLVATVTLAIAIIASVVFKGFVTVIPVLIGIIGGYLFALFTGWFFPEHALIDFSAVATAPWFGFPRLVKPEFGFVPIATFALVSLATIAEHLGDTLVTSKVVGKDFYKNPGLHRTLAGDGLATSLAALFGGPPNTTYGENVGVMAITRVYSVWVIGGAAVIAIILSLFTKFGALIQTIPVPVMGGISMMLFGIIASSGIRTLVESGIDYGDKRNLIISSVILVIGIGGGKLFFPLTDQLNFNLEGIALAALVGIILNLVLPKTLNHKEEKAAAEAKQEGNTNS